MKESELKYLQEKLHIADAMAQLYEERKKSITLHDIARRCEITVSELFDYFSDKDEIIYFYYSSLIIRYRLMIDEIEDFETFTLSEKLSNFAYTSFDLAEEREAFVVKTFRPFILHSCRETEYEKKIDALFSDFFTRDSGKAASSQILVNDCSMRLIRKKYLHLISFWLNDESEDKEVSVELTDKVTGLIQEALYTSVVDRSFDLAKFLYSNDVISKQIPFWNKITSSFEIK